jgi:hypothetical protein
MGALGGNGRFSRIARLLALCVGCLALANCTNANTSSWPNSSNGIAANASMAAMGEPMPKARDVSRIGERSIVSRDKFLAQDDTSAVVADVPKLDMTASCRQAAIDAHSDKRMQLCLDSERRWHDQLVKRWSDFALADRVACVNMQRSFEPSYTELLTCLEIARDAKSNSTQQPWKELAQH